MIAKHLKRLLGTIVIAGSTIALAHPAIAQTSGSGTTLYKTGTSVNVGQPSSNLQLSRDELAEDTHHDQIDEQLDSEGRVLDINHELRLKQLEAAQTPYKPQHIADENQQYADRKKELAQKEAIENARHQQALAALTAAAKSLIGGAASALGNAPNGGNGSPSGPAPQPNGAGNTNSSAGGAPNTPALGGGSPGNPNAGGGSIRYPGNVGGSTSNPNSGGGSANTPTLSGGASTGDNPRGGSASNPSLNGGAVSNANGAGGTGNPTLSGNTSNSANAPGESPSGPGAG